MATQVKEVVVPSDLLNVQHLLPDRSDTLFDLIKRVSVSNVQFRTVLVRGGQSLPVQVSVGGQGQLCNADERWREQVLRQDLSPMRAQMTDSRCLPSGGH